LRILPRSSDERGSARPRIAAVASLLLLTVLVIVPASSSSASSTGGISGIFESDDGDLDAVGTSGITDWNDFKGGAPSGFDTLTTADDAVGNPDDIFNGGVKQDKACPGTKSGSLGGGDSKFDVLRLYLTHKKKTGGDDYLFLAWERVPQNSTTASSHIAFEFNKGTDPCTTATDSLLKRSDGDKLLVYDFEGGSAAPTLKLLTWITDSADGPCEVSSNAVPCWGQKQDLNGSNSDAKVNTAAVGSVTDEIADPDHALGIVEFGEASIDLTNAVGADNVCSFSGHVTGVSRSSGSSGTAQMKDKVGPKEFTLPGCVANTVITTNISLDDHATFAGFDSKGAGDHTGDLTFTLYGPDDQDCDGIDDATQDDPDVIADVPVEPVYTTTIADIDSGGPWSTADGDNTDEPVGSYVVPTDAEGIYTWQIDYSGDTANTEFHSICGDETADVEYTTG
jgi:hypothetical protein